MEKKYPTIYLDLFRSTPSYRKFISMPFIYSVFIPLVILDIFMEIYHQIAFRLYGLNIISRSDYIFNDRQKLNGLTIMQKINCMYCGYANGLLAYGVKIASETEKYWCAIRHEDPNSIKVQPHHAEFLERSEFN